MKVGASVRSFYGWGDYAITAESPDFGPGTWSPTVTQSMTFDVHVILPLYGPVSVPCHRRRWPRPAYLSPSNLLLVPSCISPPPPYIKLHSTRPTDPATTAQLFPSPPLLACKAANPGLQEAVLRYLPRLLLCLRHLHWLQRDRMLVT